MKADFRVGLPIYTGEINAEKLDGWFDALETYFLVNQCTVLQKVDPASLKLQGPELTWWKFTRSKNPNIAWVDFKRQLQKQFYPMGFLHQRWVKWYNLKQKEGQSVQAYTAEFHNLALLLEVDLDSYPNFEKYSAGLAKYIQR